MFRTVIHTSEPCEYFDRASGLCRVYEKRFAACKYCGKVTIFHALFSRALPASCGYVERYRRLRIFKAADIET